MTAVQLATVLLAGLNCALALALGWIYWRNHREMRSPFTLGLLVFALFLLVHNALAVYHYFTMMSDAGNAGDNLLLIEAVLQTIASSALVWATMR
jgi:hypothetical protein